MSQKAAREHAHARGLEARLARLQARFDETYEQLQRAKAQHARTHRAVLSSSVVRGLLPSRLAAARVRAADPAVAARAVCFAETSRTFRAARAAAGTAPPAELVRLEIDGVTSWVPALREVDRVPGSRWLSKQRFPYRGILQTREVTPGGIMLDLGANVGHMSITRAILGDIAGAYCAEPDPLNFASIVRSVVDNGLEGLVLPDQVAIGARDGTARLRRGRFPGGHHIVGEADGTVEVEMLTLDSWVRRHAVPLPLVTYVKVDVQGFEPYVLDGASEVLGHAHIAWQLEFCPAMLRAHVDVRDYVARIARHFSHFTDLNRFAGGDRGRPTAELADALDYVDRETGQTDLLLFNLAG